MDHKECGRITFPHLPSGIKVVDSFTDRKYRAKRKQRPSNERKCQGEIIYVKNPLFRNVVLKRLENFKENSGGYESLTTNVVSNNTDDNYYRHKLLSPDYNFSNPQSQELNTVQLKTSQKSRKDGMKARAENRRDILIDKSSDEDYSAFNSTYALRSTCKTHINNFSNMDDAYNRRTRSARTERYFRRMSTDDGFHDTDTGAANFKTRHPAKIQDVKLSVGQHDTLPFNRNCTNNLGNRSPNSMFYNCDDDILNNPIYNAARTDLPTFYNERSADKTKPHTNRKDLTKNQVYNENIEYDKAQRSDPGSNAFLAYRNNKSPRAIHRVQYIEPQIFNYQPSQQVHQKNKLAMDPNRHVRRSHSFQSKIPRENDTRNNIPVPMRRTLTAQAASTLGNNSGNERKWFDSITSSASTTSNRSLGHVMADFERRKFYLPRERIEFKGGDKNSRKSAEPTPSYESNSTNLSPPFNDENIPLKKRSSKDLGKELSELEKMYTSLRLSDDNLLDRAEERCVEEFNLKGQSQILTNESSKYHSSSSSSESIEDNDLPGENHSHQSSEAHVINDDMAYRKMQTKKMPALSETQNSLSQISYLLASSAQILDKTEYPDFIDNVAKEEPNITKDDMVYRNLHYANNVLKIVEPQPPFGIPLRPATPSTNSNYLCSSPVALKSSALKYVPESEPNLITDDLAFRNLRKDAPKTPISLSEDNKYEFNDLSLKNQLGDDTFFRKKKKAVRSLSANLYGLINEVHNLELNIK